MRRSTVLLAAALSSLILTAAANATLPAKGANAKCDYSGTALPSTVLSEMETAGSGWTRVGVNWNSLEHAGENQWDGTYLGTLTTCFAAIHSYDSNVLVVLGPDTPLWAHALCAPPNEPPCCTSTAGPGTCPPTSDLFYKEAAEKLAQKFPASDGTDGINAFEFWNEPNTTRQWGGSATDYGNMEAAGNDGVKLYSTATTVFAGTQHFDYTWLSAAIPSGKFDVLGVHPYPNDATDYYDDPAHYLSLSGSNDSLQGYRSLLCTYKSCTAPIWFTESGFIPNNGPPLSFTQIADGLTHQFDYLAGSCTGCSNVKQVDWFTAWAPAGDTTNDPLALIGYDSNFTPNAPYYSLENLNPCYPNTCLHPIGAP